MDHKHIFIFGLGYTGCRLAKVLLDAEDWEISGTVTSVESANEVTATLSGFKKQPKVYIISSDGVVLHDTEQQNTTSSLQYGSILDNVTHVLSTAPADRSTKCCAILQSQLIRKALKVAALKGGIRWCGYLSTTSVYGDRQGGWVSENDAIYFDNKYKTRLSSRGKSRLCSEEQWLYALGLPCVVFRLPAIYGPNRGVLSKVRNGKARCVAKDGQVFSRIHVSDIVGIIVSSIERSNPGRIYNCVDDLPCCNTQVTAFACELLGKETPKTEDFKEASKTMSSMSRSFYSESKRVRNARIKKELNYELKFKNYKEGLVDQLKEEQNEWTLVPKPAIIPAKKQGEKKSIASYVFHWLLNLLRSLIQHNIAQCRSLFTLLQNKLYPKTQYNTKQVVVILVDNGSLRPLPSIQLRAIAKKLKQYSITQDHAELCKVISCSARWSNRIPSVELDGEEKIELFETVLENVVKDTQYNKMRCVVVPYFLAESKTVTEFMPSVVEKVRTKTQSTMSITISPPLVDLSTFSKPYMHAQLNTSGIRINSEVNDNVGIDSILCEMVKEQLILCQQKSVPVVLVDHGTPSLKVNKVRRALAASLRLSFSPNANTPYPPNVPKKTKGPSSEVENSPELQSNVGASVSRVLCCSMERRDGKEYDFNKPLLQDVFEFIQGEVVLVYAFLGKGKHAGEDGDIAEIIKQVQEEKEQKGEKLKIFQTGVIGEKENLIVPLLSNIVHDTLNRS